MSQAINERAGGGAGSTGKVFNIVLWVLQIAAAAMFLMAGFSKLLGNPQMVAMFDAIGVGQWLRYLTGALEVGGAILLVVPRTSGLGALVLAFVMVGAVLTHLLILGGSPLIAIVLLMVTVFIAWGRRGRARRLLQR